MMATEDTNSITEDGSPIASAGLLGRGKIMMSCTTVGSEETSLGDSSTDGACTNDVEFGECNTVTAPQNHVSHFITIA